MNAKINENYYSVSIEIEKEDAFLDGGGFWPDTLENQFNEVVKFFENNDLNSTTEELFYKKFQPLFLNILDANVGNIEENDYEEDNIRFGTYLYDDENGSDENGSFFIQFTKYNNEEHTEYISVIINFRKKTKIEMEEERKRKERLEREMRIPTDEFPF